MCTCHGSKLQSSWKSCLVSSLMLVGGFKHFLFSTIHGMSSFPLTNSYFIFFKMVVCPSCPGVSMDNSNVMNSPLQEVATIPHVMIIPHRSWNHKDPQGLSVWLTLWLFNIAMEKINSYVKLPEGTWKQRKPMPIIHPNTLVFLWFFQLHQKHIPGDFIFCCGSELWGSSFSSCTIFYHVLNRYP